MHARRVAIVLTFASVLGCSLLAPSDEEALGGTAAEPAPIGNDGAVDDSSRVDSTSSSDARTGDGDAALNCGSGVACGLQCCVACNDGVCAGCRLNGAACGEGSDCCNDNCDVGKCRVNTTCVPGGMTCSDTSSCCAGLACVYNNADGGAGGTKSCQACKPQGAQCVGGGDCCSRTCVGALCVACIELDADCDSDSNCCLGKCSHGKCDRP